MINFKTIKVNLNKRSYPILIGENLESILQKSLKKIDTYSKVVIVTDKVVNKKMPFFFKVFHNLSNKKMIKIILPSGEKTKSFSYLQYLCEKILKAKIDRDAIIICFGGGVIGDIVGLTANLLLRGIDFIQVPTTLLAQVDSSVGGKTAINSKYGKNLIGTFNQPKAVLISTDTLKTLDKRQVIAGYAEILKYAFIYDKFFFNFLKKNGKRIISLKPKETIKSIEKSCKIKARIVSKDEYEKGIREILNFGHTFGHAIESFAGFSKKILHGEAVILGMYLALKFSNFLGLCSNNLINDFTEHLEDLKIPYNLEDFDIKISYKDFIKHIKFDKKIKNTNLKFILLKDFARPIGYILKNEKVLEDFLKQNLTKN